MDIFFNFETIENGQFPSAAWLCFSEFLLNLVLKFIYKLVNNFQQFAGTKISVDNF